LLAIVLIAAAILPKDFKVERTIIIEQTVDKVYNYLRFLKHQEEYGVWYQMDKNMKKTYKGTDGKEGFISSWESKNEDVGAGSQEIVKLVDNKEILTKLRFTKPFESESYSYFHTISVSESKTKIVWGLKGSFPYPMNLMLLFMDMDKALGKDLDGGMAGLKRKIVN